MRRLGELLSGIVDEHTLGSHGDRMVSGVYDDSRMVEPESVFVAVRGTGIDGRRFVGDALARGALAVVGEELPGHADAVVLNVRDARGALATLATRWHGLDAEPAAERRLVGITGTNGKSTTAFMTRAILRAARMQCGMLGTVHYDLCSRSVVSEMTTPGPLQLAALLRECFDAGARAAVMEVSSHALHQKRTDGLSFSAAAFTNLTQDHLDYHGDLESYRAAKARLFERLDASAVAVVNRDDPNYEYMIRECPARVVTYALDQEAEVRATITRESVRGTTFRVRANGFDLVLENAIPGRHNVYNATAATGLALALGISPDAIAAGLAAVRNIPGRLQRVPCAGAADVFVDYAHTDDALRNVLGVLRPLTRRRLIVVFGCGGDRDRTKRPKMARAVAAFADAIVVTSDNPRTEEPARIIDDVLAGFDADTRRRVLVEPDRRSAIHAALAASHDGDVVLIAGKGHEDYQILGTRRVHFDDVEVAIWAAAELAGIGEP
jgi:UDP-N-acetylmuramoyl-L-alanyl-D-glutamate--2,6-diaminopimelate ligase